MDARLQGCLEKGLAPFDGVAVITPEDLPLERLRSLSRAVLAVLEGAYPSSPLWVLDDWHEHDGFLSPASPATWPQIRGHVATPENFLYFKTDEFGVAKGIYPKGESFYLRIVIDEDSRPQEGEGSLDVTVPVNLEAAVVQAFEELGLSPLREPGKVYFTRRAAH